MHIQRLASDGNYAIVFKDPAEAKDVIDLLEAELGAIKAPAIDHHPEQPEPTGQ